MVGMYSDLRYTSMNIIINKHAHSLFIVTLRQRGVGTLFKFSTFNRTHAYSDSLPSLVPRPSHHPVYDRWQYAKTEEGRPGVIYHVNDVSVYLGRQRGGEGSPVKRMSYRPDLTVSAPKHWSFECSQSEKRTALLAQNKECVCEMRPFDQDPPPPSVYLGRHWCHSHDKWYQAFPLRFLRTASDQKLDGGKAWERGYSPTNLLWSTRQTYNEPVDLGSSYSDGTQTTLNGETPMWAWCSWQAQPR